MTVTHRTHLTRYLIVLMSMDGISRHVHVTTTVRMNFSNNSHTRVASAEPGERLALVQVRGFAPHSARWLMCLH